MSGDGGGLYAKPAREEVDSNRDPLSPACDPQTGAGDQGSTRGGWGQRLNVGRKKQQEQISPHHGGVVRVACEGQRDLHSRDFLGGAKTGNGRPGDAKCFVLLCAGAAYYGGRPGTRVNETKFGS
jgi:sorbitol-specific phosphotransferase system component IIBC